MKGEADSIRQDFLRLPESIFPALQTPLPQSPQSTQSQKLKVNICFCLLTFLSFLRRLLLLTRALHVFHSKDQARIKGAVSCS